MIRKVAARVLTVVAIYGVKKVINRYVLKGRSTKS